MRRSLALAVLPVFLCVSQVQGGSRSTVRPGLDAAEVLREMNTARQHPDIYAGFLEQLRKQFHGNRLIFRKGTVLRTREGVSAVDEAIRFLRHTRPLGPLVYSKGMAMAAAEHVADQANGAIGHRGSDFSNGGERMNRHGAWHALWGENISYGHDTVRSIVLALIVDDGQRARKHRKNIFNAAFTRAGAAIGPHGRYRTVCSTEFAAVYDEAGARSGSLLARN